MDAMDILVDQINEKIAQLKNFISDSKPETFEEYKRLCGEVRGLSIAQGYALDLKKRMENSNE
jgi:hypothetical protein